jgi:hypothetical protein
MKGISYKTVTRILCIKPEYMCVDGTQTKKLPKLLDPYKKEISEFVERGFQPSQIFAKLRNMFPCITIKRTTLSDFCIRVREELFEYTPSLPENAPVPSEDSILVPYTNKINEMLSENKLITMIFAAIKEDGYFGSYSLLQQYCQTVRPTTHRTKKSIRKIKRKDLSLAIWTGKSTLSEQDVAFINANYSVLDEIKSIIAEFRTAYSNKDIDAVKSWCDKYSQCKFPAISSFIKGINIDDTDAFYNSMKYDYSNGLLEGCVNKLKTIKRSMYGRASYVLLRAKLLLANGN